MAKAPDPYGYGRLIRWLTFLERECDELGALEERDSLRYALEFTSGSPSEFMHESAVAVGLVARTRHLPLPIRDFAKSVGREIERGFKLVGGA